MNHVLAALGVGMLGYLGLCAFQSPQSRRDLEAWGDVLFISGMLTTFLVVVMFWGILGTLAETSLAAVVDEMSWRKSSGRINSWTLLGFAAAPFTVLAAVHVLVLKLLERARRRHLA